MTKCRLTTTIQLDALAQAQETVDGICFAQDDTLYETRTFGTKVKGKVVADPQRDIDQYRQDAEQQGVHIRYVFLTHFHANVLAGHLELRDRTGATICLGVPVFIMVVALFLVAKNYAALL